MDFIVNCVFGIRIWIIESKLKRNDSKTEFLIIASLYMKTPAGMELLIGQATITPSTSCRNLGAMFDINLKMRYQLSLQGYTFSICEKLEPLYLASLSLQLHGLFIR